MKKIKQKIIYLISRAEIIYKISKKITDYHNNNNNCDIRTNGEGYFIEKHKETFDIVFDVGANIGEWSQYMYNAKPNSKIYSFEPSKQTFTRLKENIKNPNNKIYNLGLGKEKENKIFYNYGEESALNSQIERKSIMKKSYEEDVKFDTLDNFCGENSTDNISFLKIDVEGGELDVLKGSVGKISSGKIDYIQFEYGGTFIDARVFLKDIFDFFEDKPYTIYKITQNGLKKINKYDPSLDNFQYSNFIAKKNGNN
jgi:FkbM family methyltransferase